MKNILLCMVSLLSVAAQAGDAKLVMTCGDYKIVQTVKSVRFSGPVSMVHFENIYEITDPSGRTETLKMIQISENLNISDLYVLNGYTNMKLKNGSFANSEATINMDSLRLDLQESPSGRERASISCDPANQ